jgi:hypothetical protein
LKIKRNADCQLAIGTPINNRQSPFLDSSFCSLQSSMICLGSRR